METSGKRLLRTFVVLSGVALLAVHGQAQARPGVAATIPVLMVSDIHFEPFWDPAKVQKLASAPVPQWEAILASPESANRAGQFAALQEKCKTRGEDTSFLLLRSSLEAIKLNARGARFALVSGDLISHGFACKFNSTVATRKPGAYQSFVEKTVGFVQMQLHKNLPQTPIYSTLGNNDSDCDDYELDPQSPFLSDVGSLLIADLAKPNQKQALTTFTAQGDYSVLLPSPMHAARLLAVDDLFQSTRYRGCGGQANTAAAEEQLAWLRSQLEAARKNHEKIWVMSHIPPGIDPYSTIRSLKNICAGEPTTQFLSSDALGSTLAEFGDVVQLAIFGHTHMDELRLLKPAADSQQGASPVAAKIVPSISPVDGNNPSFVVAQVNPATATLEDYRVIAASNQTGVNAKWTEEYAFKKTYGTQNFGGGTVAELVAGFKADQNSADPVSAAYLKNYFAGDASQVLKLFWPQYVCALDNRTTETYRACLCGSGK